MTELPTGTVTFLFTDVEGSTRLMQELGDGYSAVHDDHAAIVRRSRPRICVTAVPIPRPRAERRIGS